MGTPAAVAFRLGPETTRLLVELAARLEVDKTAVMRLAIRRLAKSEGIASPAPTTDQGARRK